MELLRKHHDFFEDYGLIIVLAIAAIFLLGDFCLEDLFCDDSAIIWVVLIVLLLTCFDFDF
ncbi:MAG: hypothetical protein R3Y64_01200 [Peptostreptococcaceae bacterium]